MSGLEVVVLGATGTFPSPEGPTSGFLLRSGGSAVWVDAGTGTFANLQRYTNFFDLEALILSHMHLDHILDVYPLYYGLRYSPQTRGPKGFKVYAPEGAGRRLETLVSIGGGPHHDGFAGYLDFKTLSAGQKLELGPFKFIFQNSVHPLETFAMRVEAGGRVLGYTADSGPSDDLMQIANGADVLIAEASMQHADENLAEVHMTAEEAGRLASRAGVSKLVLTHIVPGLDPAVSVAQAGGEFTGEVVAAKEHMRFQV